MSDRSETSQEIVTRILSIADVDDADERQKLAREVSAYVEREYDGLDATNDDLAAAHDELLAEAEGSGGDIADAVNEFIDEIQRPVGSLKFIVPQSDSVNRALLGLHDAVGRKL